MNYVSFCLLKFLYCRCIKTYEIEFSSVASGKFRRVNPQDTIFLSFQYSVPTGKYAQVVLLYGTKEGGHCIQLPSS
jgi:hypothetical protein